MRGEIMSLREKAKTSDQIFQMVVFERNRQKRLGITFPRCDELWISLEDAEQALDELKQKMIRATFPLWMYYRTSQGKSIDIDEFKKNIEFCLKSSEKLLKEEEANPNV
jgi:hypothetical protein